MGEMRDSGQLLRGILLNDTLVRGLAQVWLFLESVSFWEGGWLSLVLGVILIPCMSGLADISSFSLWGVLVVGFLV